MKKLVAISLFLFFVFTTAVVAAGLVVRELNRQKAGANVSTAGAGNVDTTTAGATNVVLNMAELYKHSTADNCWLLISGKVYDVTGYMYSHPGGTGEILNSCGTDATAAFNTTGGRGTPHSAGASSILAAYYIGDLNQKINQQQLNDNIQRSTSVPPPLNNWRDD